MQIPAVLALWFNSGKRCIRAHGLQVAYRTFVVLILGFASGLPLALTGGAMQAWLTLDGIGLTTIGFLGLVALPYTFKFLWAPLMDRFELPWLGRRRGWIVIMQLFIAAFLLLLSQTSPSSQLQLFGALALCVAFASASLDIVIDAYRTDLLPASERGLGSSFGVLGYRIAMIVSGGVTLVWAEQWQSWPKVYMTMAYVMAGLAVVTLILLPKIHSDFKPLASDPKRELLGFASLLLGVLVGYYASQHLLELLGLNAASNNNWERLFFVMVQIICALGVGLGFSRRVGFATLNQSFDSFFSSKGAWLFLLLIVLYKVGDAFAVSITTPFLIRGLGFTQIEVGIANKTIAMLTTIVGAMLGGLIMMRIRLSTALFYFGVLQLVSNAGYYLLAELGKGAWGTIQIPSFNLLIVKLATATEMDTLMLLVIGGDNFVGGMGTAAFLALLMSLCNRKFSATHFALLSAFASLGRVFVGPFSGVLVEQIGWPNFYLSSLIVAAPGVLLVVFMRRKIDGLTDSIEPSNNK